MARLLLGTSGWVYNHWRGVFYPERMPPGQWFSYYARHFDSVEINNSFYRLPSREVFEEWRRMAPPGFDYTVKASRYITHVKKLKDPGRGLGNFYDNLDGLADRCAAVLFQLPPRFHLNLERLECFLGALSRRYRNVMEFRDESWLTGDVYSLLRRHGVALCWADSPFYPGPGERTADFSFFRRHGGHGGRGPGYGRGELERLARQVRRELDEGRDCFVYFNNDPSGYAVKNALALENMLVEGRGDGGAGTARRRGEKKIPGAHGPGSQDRKGGRAR